MVTLLQQVDCTSYYELEQQEYARKGVNLTPQLWVLKLMVGAVDRSYDEQVGTYSTNPRFETSIQRCKMKLLVGAMDRSDNEQVIILSFPTCSLLCLLTDSTKLQSAQLYLQHIKWIDLHTELAVRCRIEGIASSKTVC